MENAESEAWDLSDLGNECHKIMKLYMELNVGIRESHKTELWESLEESLEGEGGIESNVDKEGKFDTDTETFELCRRIKESMFRDSRVSVDSVDALSKAIGKQIHMKWRLIIEKAINEGMEEEIPLLSEAYKIKDKWKFIWRLRGRNKETESTGKPSSEDSEGFLSETKIVIKKLGLFPEWFGERPGEDYEDSVFTERIKRRIPPFGDFMGSDLYNATWRAYRNSFEYVEGSLAGDTTQKNRIRTTLKCFFEDPCFGKKDSEVGVEVAKVIGFCSKPEHAEEGVFEKLCRQADLTHTDTQFRREEVRKRLAFYDTHDWVDPKKKMNELCKLAFRGGVVEIIGEGGLGKTALCNEFIRNNLDGKTSFGTGETSPERILPYDYYILLSSKKYEVETTIVDAKGDGLTGAGHPSNSLTDYFDEGDIDTLFDKLNRLPEGGDGPQGAKRALMNNRVLVLVDNFEDVIDSHQKAKKADSGSSFTTNFERYQEFFENLANLQESLVLVTSRMPSLGDKIQSLPIVMEGVTLDVGIDILKSRFIWLASQADVLDFRFREEALNAIMELGKSTFDVVVEEVGGEFRKNMGSPLIILYYARTLGPKSMDIRKIEDKRVLQERILRAAASDGGLKQKIQNVEDWTTDRAYDLLMANPDCQSILLNMHKTPEFRTMRDIQDVVQTRTRDSFVIAWRNLMSYSLLIDTSYAGDEERTYRMSTPGNRVLARRSESKASDKGGSGEINDPALDIPISNLNTAIAESNDVMIEKMMDEVIGRIESPEGLLEKISEKDHLVILCKSRGISSSGKSMEDLRLSLKNANFQIRVTPRIIDGLIRALESLALQTNSFEQIDRGIKDKFESLVLSYTKKAMRGGAEPEALFGTRTKQRLLQYSLSFISEYKSEVASSVWKKDLLISSQENIEKEIENSTGDTRWIGTLVDLMVNKEMVPTIEDNYDYLVFWTTVIFNLRFSDKIDQVQAKDGLNPAIILLERSSENNRIDKEAKKKCVDFLFELRDLMDKNQATISAPEFRKMGELETKTIRIIKGASDLRLFDVVELSGAEESQDFEFENATLDFSEELPSSPSSWVVVERVPGSRKTKFSLSKSFSEREEDDSEDDEKALEELENWTIEVVSGELIAKADRGNFTLVSQLGSSWLNREDGESYVPATAIVKSNGLPGYQDFTREVLKREFGDRVEWKDFGNERSRVKIIRGDERPGIDLEDFSTDFCKKFGIDTTSDWEDRDAIIFKEYHRESTAAYIRYGRMTKDEARRVRKQALKKANLSEEKIKLTALEPLLEMIEKAILKTKFKRPESLLYTVKNAIRLSVSRGLREDSSIGILDRYEIKEHVKNKIDMWENRVEVKILYGITVHKRQPTRGKGRPKLSTRRGGRK